MKSLIILIKLISISLIIVASIVGEANAGKAVEMISNYCIKFKFCSAAEKYEKAAD